MQTMHAKLPLITDIQKYSIHDGPGIRTTVFFKGCPLSCIWCHNPETQNFQTQILTYTERCVGCGACKEVCSAGAVQIRDGKALTDPQKCQACGACEDWCVKNARELCGKAWELPELLKELLKDRAFYETSGGGVTLSGGEVMAQNMDYLEELMQHLRQRGIRIVIDTCGDVPYERFARVLPYTELFLYDFKIADEEKHRKYTGRSNQRILENLEQLSSAGANIWIRIPVIGTVNDDPASIGAIGAWLQSHRIQIRQISLLPYHNTGSSKYPRLGRSYEGGQFTTPDAEHMEQLRMIMEQFELAPVSIGG